MMKFTALAACAALIFGLGWQSLGRQVQPPLPTDNDFPLNIATATPGPFAEDTDPDGFVAQGPAAENKLAFPDIWGVTYTDTTHSPEIAASLAFPPGSYWVELDKEAIQKIFWGAAGKPAVENPKTDTGDFPLFLMGWQGYRITGQACYDGSGALWRLTIRGEKGEDSFTLTLCPDHIPPECMVYPDQTATTVVDTSVTGWYQVYDCDGDDQDECIVSSSFLVGGYGVTFKNIGSGGAQASEAGGGDATDLGGAQLFNAMLVNHFCRWDSAPYVDHLLHNDDIPAWEETNFDTLAAARERTDFAPYLPQAAPVSWSEFHGRVSYQEGDHNYLFVRWSKMYDNVEIDVHLPEGESTNYYHSQLVDVNVPASYDWRLYDGPICDTVPQEYRSAFYKPAFRAGDMSPEVVRARMHEHDTGGEICHFYVIHENGVVVSYDCSGVTAEAVWALVEETLK